MMIPGPPPRPRLGLKKRLSLELLRSYRRQSAILHPLRYLLWECTLRCPLACAHCGSDCRAEAATPDMPLRDFLKVLTDVKARSDPAQMSVGLTGGEPLMRPDLAECGWAIRGLGFAWGMVTSGYLLSETRLAELLGAGLGSLTVSLDGFEASHEALRGRRGSFNRSLAAIRAAASAPGLRLDAVTCVNQRNLSELPALRELLIESGVKAWRLFSVFPRGRAAGADWLQLDPARYRSLMDLIAAFRREGGIAVDYGCEGYLGAYEGEVRDYYYFCRSGINFASILCDGSIAGCASARGDFVQGSVYRDSFMDVWEKGFTKMRDRSWTRKGPCAACPSYRYCEGNGLHLWSENGEGPMRCNLAELEAGR